MSGISDFFGDIGNGVEWWWKHVGAGGLTEDGGAKERFKEGYDVGSQVGEKAMGAVEAAPVVGPVIERSMAAMRWLRDNVVSQPLSTVILVGKYNRRNSAWDSDPFQSGTWSRAWKAANHISPGQAAGLDPKESEDALNSPLVYYKPAESYLPPGFNSLPVNQQQQILKQAGMPAIGNQFIEKKRADSPWFKYGSGTADFAAAMFADPTVIAFGAASKAARARNVAKMPKGGWDATQIDAIMNSNKVKALMDGIWRNRENSQLLNNTVLARRSGMGPRFGAIVASLKDPEELSLFIRTGMGDKVAMDELRSRNAMIEARMNSMDSRLANLGLMRTRYTSFPSVQNMIDQQIDKIQQARNADSVVMARYDDILANRNLLDELHYGRWVGPDAARITRAQNKYVAAAGRGMVADVNGVTHTRIVGQGGYFAGPVTLVRMLQNAHPNGYMDISMNQSPQALKDSVAELRGHLARIPGIRPEVRGDFVNRYLKTTTEHERKDLLEEIGRLGTRMVGRKHGVSQELADELYKEYIRQKYGAIQSLKERYTAALDPERMRESGQPMYLDELPDKGGAISVTPTTATRVIKGHTFQDLDALNRILARHGGRLEKLRVGLGSAKDAIEQGSDYLTYLWKFGTLLRLGYVPRVLGDDLGSQWASVGSGVMALRGYRGVVNAFDNAARWIAKPALQAREGAALAGAQYAADEMALLRPNIVKLRGQLAADQAQRIRDVNTAMKRHTAAQAKLAALNPADRTAKALAVRNFAAQRTAQLRAAQVRHAAGASPGKTQRLSDMVDRHDMLGRYRDLSSRQAEDYRASYQKVIQGSQHVMIDGRPFPAAFEGRSGQYAQDQISSTESLGNLLSTNKQLIRVNLERSYDHGARVISATQDAAEHMKDWVHVINNQIMQDPLSKLAVRGWSIEEMTNWLTANPRGIRYRARLPKNIHEEEFARSAKYEVDQYLHTPEIRQKALEDPKGVNAQFLEKAVPVVADRPDIHGGEIGLSQLQHMNALDRVIDGFYRYFASIPADRMSRHPLFNAFYEGHVKTMVGQWKKQTGKDTSRIPVREVEEMAHAARQLSLRDTRALVFDIAHRSDAAAAMRFMSPFFSATAEAFQRWGRVIADKPQLAGYAANWFNAPAYLGAVQDMDGNKVDEFGYTYIPQYPLKPDGTPDYTKKPTVIKRMVPKSERYIITRLPKWVVDSPLGAALNVRESDGRLLLSQNSVNLVTQGDPFFNPGFGPVVQVPVNEFVKDKPRTAELARHLGILPFGVQGGGLFGDTQVGRAINMALPATIKNFLTQYDTSDQRYQMVKMQIMNRMIFEYQQRHHGDMPSQAEIGKFSQEVSDRTKQYWKFAAYASFIQPFATQRKDPYQFYYDQYRNLRNQNAKTADDQFLKRYGESYFIFASEITKSAGIPPTMKAVDLMRKYGKMIAQNPELAPLVIGPEGNGPFSPEAYRYELNNPLTPDGAEMARSKLTAEQAIEENRRRLGWAKYTKKMNELTATLHKAGYATFQDDGAEDLLAEKRAWTSLYAEPLYPDGTPNPYYNEAWSKDFFTQDQRKYERMIPALTQIANSDLAKLSGRSDLRKLQEYLGGRKALIGELNSLKASGLPYTLDAQDNAELRYQWALFVDGLIEESPRFGDLYHRYLSNDMGVNAPREVQQ